MFFGWQWMYEREKGTGQSSAILHRKVWLLTSHLKFASVGVHLSICTSMISSLPKVTGCRYCISIESDTPAIMGGPQKVGVWRWARAADVSLYGASHKLKFTVWVCGVFCFISSNTLAVIWNENIAISTHVSIIQDMAAPCMFPIKFVISEVINSWSVSQKIAEHLDPSGPLTFGNDSFIPHSPPIQLPPSFYIFRWDIIRVNDFKWKC